MVPASRMSAIKKRGGLVLLLFATLMWQACDPPGPSALLRGERLIQDGKYQSAITSLREATTLLPNNAQAWNHLGLAYHWERQYNQAVQAYRKALDLNYELAPARFNLGSLLLEINQPKLAVTEFESYTLLRKEEPEGWFRRGMSEWRDRQWDAAYDSFKKSLSLDQAQPIVWNSIGVIELYRKNPTGADHAFREALKHQQNYAPAIYNTAIVSHFHLPRSPNDPRPYALERYRQYLALQPAPLFTDAIRGFANSLDQELNPRPVAPVVTAATNQTSTNVTQVTPIAPETNTVAAIVTNVPTTTNRVVVSSPPPEPPKTNVAVILPTNTVAATNTVVRVEPKQPEKTNAIVSRPLTNVVVTPAGGLNSPSNTTKVASLPPPPLETVTVTPAPPIQPAPTTTPNPNLAATAAANLNRVLSEPRATVSTPTLSSSADIAPAYTGLRYAYLNPPAPTAGLRHRARPYFEEGRRLQRLTQWNDAIAAYRKAIGLDGAYFEAYHNLGLAAGERDFLRAAIAYETALALRPNSSSTRYNFATLLNKKQYHRDAALELVKLVQQDPENVQAHLLLATIFDKHLKQTSLARKHYARVIEIQPAHREGTAIRYWLRAN